jgi:adenosylcobinamide-GDP ribazoletransferase
MTGPWGRCAGLAASAAGAAALAAAGAALGPAALAGAAGLALAAGGVAVWARARLGGVTGDILGAVQQAGTLGFLLGALAWR